MGKLATSLGRLLAGLLGLVLLALLPSTTAHAAAPQSIALLPCVARIQAGDTPAQLLATPSRFDCTHEQTSFGAGDYWVMLSGPPVDTASPRSLAIATNWQDSLTLHVLRADGSLTSQHVPSSRLSRFTRVGAEAVFPLDSHPSQITAILLRMKGVGNMSGIVRSARVSPPDLLREREQAATALYGGFAGLAFGLLVYNFVLWFTMRERFQLYYCAMTAALIVYASSYSGALSVLFPALDSNDRLRISYLTLALAAVGGAKFALHFFEKPAIPRWLRRVSDVGLTLILLSALAFVALAPLWLTVLDRIYLLVLAPLPLLISTTAIVAWRAGSRFVGVYVLAWSLPVMMTVVRILHAAHLIDMSFLVDHSTVLAMSCESLLSSLAMAYRIKLIRRERDVAKAEEAFARRLADVDPLTGLLNRRALLTKAMAVPGLHALAIYDLDHFKKINDRFGHGVGDHVLKDVAHLLAAMAPAGSLVARLGGEEFVVLGPSVQVRAAVRPTLAAVKDMTMPEIGHVTASAGVAEGMIETEEDWQALYLRADAALYRAKAAGRNRAEEDLPLAAAA